MIMSVRVVLPGAASHVFVVSQKKTNEDFLFCICSRSGQLTTFLNFVSVFSHLFDTSVVCNSTLKPQGDYPRCKFTYWISGILDHDMSYWFVLHITSSQFYKYNFFSTILVFFSLAFTLYELNVAFKIHCINFLLLIVINTVIYFM